MYVYVGFVLQMNNFFYHKGNANSLPFTAVTVYPITTSDHFYLLHDLVSRVRLEGMMKDITIPIADQGQAELRTGTSSSHLWPWFDSHKNPSSKYELLTWNYFNSSQLFLSYEHQPVIAIPMRLRESINKALQIVVAKMNATEREDPHVPPYTLIDGFLSVDEAMGIEYHFHMSATRRSSGVQVNYLAQVFLPFGGPGMSVYRETSPLEGTTIHLIVPVGNSALTPFLEFYEVVCLKDPLPIQLHLVFFSHDEPMKRKISQMRDVYPHAMIQTHELQGQRFSHSTAYAHVADLLPDSSLMVFFDISFEFSLTFFTHCRLNAIRGRQVYFPVLFSLYQAELLERESQTAASMMVSPDTGFFLRYNYQVAAIYKSDFVCVGGFRKSSPESHQESDDMVFVNNILRTNVFLMRALEPNLWRKFQRRRCDTLQGNSQKSCYNSLADSVGSKRTLGAFVVTQNLIDTI